MFRWKFVVAVLAAMFVSAICAGAAKAQSIRFFNTRGQEIREGNPFPLDRFARGETCNVRVSNPDGSGRYEVWSARGFERGGWNFWWNMQDTFQIFLSPAADNIEVWVRNDARRYWVYKRIPVGTK